MHEFAPLTIWFSLYIAGMLLTMLMPTLFSKPSRIERNQDDPIHAASYDRSEWQKASVNVLCCGPSHESLDFQTCCSSSI